MTPLPKTLREASAALLAGAFTPESLLEDILSRIEEKNPRLNAYLTVTAKEARATAKSAPRGPLYGLPIALKDLFDAQGVPTTAGGTFWRQPAEQDAYVTAQLKAAGAILV